MLRAWPSDWPAILTCYHGPTEEHGARISAEYLDRSLVQAYDYALSVPENHTDAAQALCRHLGLRGSVIGGELPGGHWAWIFITG